MCVYKTLRSNVLKFLLVLYRYTSLTKLLKKRFLNFLYGIFKGFKYQNDIVRYILQHLITSIIVQGYSSVILIIDNFFLGRVLAMAYITAHQCIDINWILIMVTHQESSIGGVPWSIVPPIF